MLTQDIMRACEGRTTLARCFLCGLLLWALPGLVQAAPWPAAPGSGQFLLEANTYRSTLFEVHTRGTQWQQTPVSLESGGPVFALFQAPPQNGAPRPALSLRLNTINPSAKGAFKKYAMGWLQYYPQLGFKVLKVKRVQVNRLPAYVFDMVQTKGHRRLRQVLLAHNKKGHKHVAVFTCSAHRKSFLQNLPSCHNIIKNFKWL